VRRERKERGTEKTNENEWKKTSKKII